MQHYAVNNWTRYADKNSSGTAFLRPLIYSTAIFNFELIIIVRKKTSLMKTSAHVYVHVRDRQIIRRISGETESDGEGGRGDV